MTRRREPSYGREAQCAASSQAPSAPFVDAAQRVHRNRAFAHPPREAKRADGRCARMAFRCEHRRQQDGIDAQPGRKANRRSRMCRGGDDPAGRARGSPAAGGAPDRSFGEMQSVGADCPGQPPVIGDQQADTSTSAKRLHAPRQARASLAIPLAYDDSTSAREAPDCHHRIGQALAIGHQDQARQGTDRGTGFEVSRRLC